MPLRDSLQKVTRLQGVNYEWRTKEFPSKNFDEATQIGFIAQDIERIVPEVVKTDALGYKALSYDKLTVLLVEAVKELKVQKDAELTSKNAEIKELKATYNELKQEMAEIKRLLAK